MYEKRRHPLATKKTYIQRLGRSFILATVFMVASLLLGVAGYHFIGNLPWIDALVNASMILGGMGPVDVIKNDAGKLFTSFYALYSGVSFLTAFSILMAPALHRLLHKFHLDRDDKE